MRHVAVAVAVAATVAVAVFVWPSTAPKIVNLGKANNKCDPSSVSQTHTGESVRQSVGK